MKESHILVVDDEPANQFLLEGLLSAHNYKPIIASGGSECLEILTKQQPDLVLLDIMMPKMNGIEVLSEIMKDEIWKRIPVIMVSAKTASSDIQTALSMGAIDYIKKPFDEMELLARVKVGIRLKENDDRLYEMVKLRDDFVKIISHDLRSPFTAIYGFAEILAKADNLTNQQKRSLGYILESVEYSDDYFNKLLSWTMLDHGDIILSYKDFNARGLIEGVIRILQHKAEAKKQKIINKVDSELILSADETFFRQIFANLLNNAIKFTPEAGCIEFSNFTENGMLNIQISDSGIGMPEEVSKEWLIRDSILPTRKGTRGEKGTGIGLSICRKITDAHGFGFDFRRNTRGGTDFTISCNQIGAESKK